MQFECEVHKNRVKVQQDHIEVLERKIEHYIEQQALFKLMKHDLDKYKKVYEMTKELQTIYSPFTPLNQFKEQELISLPRRNDIVDLTEIMKETSQGFEKLQQEIKVYQDENTKLKALITKLEAQTEQQERNLDKLREERAEYLKSSG